MADEPIYEKGTVRVTSTRFTVGAADYPIASLSSIATRLVSDPRNRAFILGVASLFAALYAAPMHSPFLAGFGVVGLITSAALVFRGRRVYALFVTTAGSERKALTGEWETISEIAEALRAAIDKRG